MSSVQSGGMKTFGSGTCLCFSLCQSLYPELIVADTVSSLLYRWEYIPFSGGPRICLGQQFALTQIEYALFKFFRAFKSIEPRDDNGPQLLRTNLTVTFAKGCLVSATPDSN